MNANWNNMTSKLAVLIILLYGTATVLTSMITMAATTVTATVVVQNTCNLAPSNTAVAFSITTPGTNTIGTVNAITIIDTGANPSNILLSGSSWSDGGSHTFGVSNTIYSGIAANDLWTPGTTPSATANVEVMFSNTPLDTLLETSNGVAANTVWLGLSIPASQYGATYTQTITISSNC